MFAVLIAAGIAASGQFDGPPPRNSIIVHQRFASMLCAGACVDSDLLVRSDGFVDLRVKRIEQRDWKSFRYRASPLELRAFQEAYAAIRPQGLAGPIGACDSAKLTIDWDIGWEEPGKPSRLLACTGATKVRQAFIAGFRALRISPVTGERLSSEAAELL